MALSSITAIYSASDTLPCDGPANKRETTYNRADENHPVGKSVAERVYLASVKFSLKELPEALEAVKFLI